MSWHPLGPEKVEEPVTEKRIAEFVPDRSAFEKNVDLTVDDIADLLTHYEAAKEKIYRRRFQFIYAQALAYYHSEFQSWDTRSLLKEYRAKGISRIGHDLYYGCDYEKISADKYEFGLGSELFYDALRIALDSREHVARGRQSRKTRRRIAEAKRNPTRQRPVMKNKGRRA